MLSFRQFQRMSLQIFILVLLVFGLHREAAADTFPLPSVTVESAGWDVQGASYELNGSVTRPKDVSVSQINISFTAVPIPGESGQSWLLPAELSWVTEAQCSSTPPLLCDVWQVNLDTSTLPIGDYNVSVSGEFDPSSNFVDIFGDTDDERCSFNCPDEGMPTCNGGLCQQGTEPEVRFLPALPGLYASVPTLEVS